MGWYDPRIVPYADFAMDPASMVLHYGQAIFEGTKAYRRPDGEIQLFRPQANMARMSSSAQRMCMPALDEELALEGLKKQGFKTSQVYTTLELRMKCGIGKCGRCNIGTKYVCKDGPVFRCDQIDELPQEY